MKKPSTGMCRAIGIAALAIAGFYAQAQQNVLQPSDPIIASSNNSPGSEGVANAIDLKPTKYLNFDSRTPEPIKPSGFVVSPAVGGTRVTGMTIQSANDAVERDPKVVTLEGSNDAVITGFGAGNWTSIAMITAAPFAARFETQTSSFANNKPFKHYRWTVLLRQACGRALERRFGGWVGGADREGRRDGEDYAALACG